MSRARDTMSPDLEAADADIISSAVSSRPKRGGGRGRAKGGLLG